MTSTFYLENCQKLAKINYDLVLLASVQAKRLSMGVKPLIEKADQNEKPHFTALREISMGLHDYHSLHEKLLSHIRNSMVGITDDAINSAPKQDRFNEEAILNCLTEVPGQDVIPQQNDVEELLSHFDEYNDSDSGADSLANVSSIEDLAAEGEV